MEQMEHPRFLLSLDALAELFSDPMSELRKRAYWGILRDRISLEEWEYGCMQAMERETFHKVPLPAVMLDYAREYRKVKREERDRAQRQTLQLMAPEESLEKVRELIAGVFRDDRLKDPIPPYDQETP